MLKSILYRLWLVVAVASFSVNAATHYIDVDAAGLNNGSSWINAWESFADINYASISPGDTVYVSGGTYNEGTISWGVGGTDGNIITVKASQAAGHNDPIIFNGSFSMAGRNYLTFDGAKSDVFDSITNTFDVPNISTNINWKIVCNDYISCFNFSGGSGMRSVTWKWLELTLTNGLEFVPNHNGILANPSSSIASNNVVEYVWMHDLSQDGIHWVQGVSNPTRTWGDVLTVRYSLIERLCDDGIEISTGGVTVHHTIIRDGRYGGSSFPAHADAMQTVGNYYRIYNNVWYDIRNSCGRYQSGNMGDGETWGPNVFFGNVLGTKNETALNDPLHMYTFNRTIDPVIADSYWTNWVFVNNTLYRARNGDIGVGNAFKKLTTPHISDFVCANNIFWSATNYMVDLFATGATTDPADMIFDYNNCSGNASYAITYSDGATYYGAGAFNAAGIENYTNNSSANPSFINSAGNDFRLASDDTVAMDKGMDLSYLTNLCSTNLLVDLWGNLRGQNSAWDVGAMEVTDTNIPPIDPLGSLQLSLSFEGDFSDAIFEDSSGYGHDLLMYGWSGSYSNWPTQVYSDRGEGSYGAHFVPQYGWFPYPSFPAYKTGQYGAITNVGLMNGMTQATFTAWVKFTDVGTTYAARSSNWNGTIMDAGYDIVGGWKWGRHSSTTFGEPQFLIMTNTGGVDNSIKAHWPQVKDYFWYTNSVWQYLSATVDCSTPTNLLLNLFWNGTNVLATNYYLPSFPVPSLKIYDVLGSTWGPWIAVGCWSHNASPPLEDADEKPNNGWLDGTLDEVRIYNRVLLQSEIVALMGNDEPPTDVDPPSPNPMTWENVPQWISNSEVTMRCTTATDTVNLPVQYYFTETTGHAGSTNSGWQSSSTWTATGLSDVNSYAYTVRSRDAVGNETAESSEETVAAKDIAVGPITLHVNTLHAGTITAP